MTTHTSPRWLIASILLLSLCFPTGAWAKEELTPRMVLDKACSWLDDAQGTSINFTLTSLEGKTVKGTTSGSMDMKGSKYRLRSKEVMAWYNGCLQWTMQKGDTEVNLTEPTVEEQHTTNPYSLLRLYKSESLFDAKMKQGKLSNGAQGYKVYLTAKATNTSQLREVFVEVASDGYRLVRISFRQGRENWTRIVIDKIETGVGLTDQDFVFPAQEYPDAEVIDLR